eukprot:261386_1
MAALAVLGSQHVRSTYFNSPHKVPDVSDHQEIGPDGEPRKLWTYCRSRFNYDKLFIKIQTKDLIQNVLDCDKNNNIHFPISSTHSGEYITTVVHQCEQWPPWIPIKQNQFSFIEIEFQDDSQCVHWEHWREGTVSVFDMKDIDAMKTKTTRTIWNDHLTEMAGTAQELYCNTSGHFKNYYQVQNFVRNHVQAQTNNFEQAFNDIEGKDQQWMGQMIQNGINYKKSDILKAERGLEWDNVGWYQVLDLLNCTFGIWSFHSCEPLTIYDWPEGIFIDEMAGLVTPLWSQKLLHCIGFVQNPSGRLPLAVFEFIYPNWTAESFEYMLKKWWMFTTREYNANIGSLNSDWDRKLMSGMCSIANGFSLCEYLYRCYGIAEGSKCREAIPYPIFSCHGHAAGQMCRKYTNKKNTKMLLKRYWTCVRLTKSYVMWLKLVSFFKWLVETEQIDTTQDHRIPLVEPWTRVNLSSEKADEFDIEMKTLKDLRFEDSQKETAKGNGVTNIEWLTKDLSDILTDLPANNLARMDSEEYKQQMSTENERIIIPFFGDEQQRDARFKMTVNVKNGRTHIAVFQQTITSQVTDDKLLLHIEDRSCEQYCWFAYVQYFGCYSPVIHNKRKQYTTGVGERGNRNRRDIKAKVYGSSIDRYCQGVVENDKQQWEILRTDLQASSSVVKRKKKKNPKSKYKEKYKTQTKQEQLIKVKFDQAKNYLGTILYPPTNAMIVKSMRKQDTNGAMINWNNTTFGKRLTRLEGSFTVFAPRHAEKQQAFILSWCKKVMELKFTEKESVEGKWSSEAHVFMCLTKATTSKKRTYNQIN